MSASGWMDEEDAARRAGGTPALRCTLLFATTRVNLATVLNHTVLWT